MIDWCVATFRMSAGLKLNELFYRSSHGNSEKKHERQVGVAEDIAKQLGTTETGENIMGVMIESHLVAGECRCPFEPLPSGELTVSTRSGKQSIPAAGPVGLTYGQSVTYVPAHLKGHTLRSRPDPHPPPQRRLHRLDHDRFSPRYSSRRSASQAEGRWTSPGSQPSAEWIEGA